MVAGQNEDVFRLGVAFGAGYVLFVLGAVLLLREDIVFIGDAVLLIRRM